MPKHHNHPSEHLAKKLKDLSMSSAALARHISVPANRISQILSGKRPIAVDTALRLGQCLSTEPDYWLNLQAQYELEQARHLGDDEIAGIKSLHVSRRESI